MLDSLKGIKMASQDSVAYQTLTELRTCEIKDSSSFRWIMLMTNFLCKFPNPVREDCYIYTMYFTNSSLSTQHIVP